MSGATRDDVDAAEFPIVPSVDPDGARVGESRTNRWVGLHMVMIALVLVVTRATLAQLGFRVDELGEHHGS
jgi:hypothetical protein